MNADDLRERLKGTSTAAVEEAEKRRRAEEADQRKTKAREQELGRWNERARKPMKRFEATVADITAETRTGIYERGERAGDEWSTDVAVLVLDDVNCLEGTPASSIDLRLPEPGKDFSKYSEAAIMVRKAVEGGNMLDNLYDIVGKRWLFEGDWEPTFTNDRGFWQGTYYYRLSLIGAPVKEPEAPQDDSLKKLATFVDGKSEDDFTAPDLLKQFAPLGIKDPALQGLLMSGGKSAFLEAASEKGFIARSEEGKLVSV